MHQENVQNTQAQRLLQEGEISPFQHKQIETIETAIVKIGPITTIQKEIQNAHENLLFEAILVRESGTDIPKKEVERAQVAYFASKEIIEKAGDVQITKRAIETVRNKITGIKPFTSLTSFSKDLLLL